MLKSRLGLPVAVNYTLYDMVTDTIAVLDGQGMTQSPSRWCLYGWNDQPTDGRDLSTTGSQSLFDYVDHQ